MAGAFFGSFVRFRAEPGRGWQGRAAPGASPFPTPGPPSGPDGRRQGARQRRRSLVREELGGRGPTAYYGSRLLYAGVPENDVADWMGHSSTDVLREHYHYIFEGAEQRGRATIATMLTPGADDPKETSEVA